MIQPSVYGQAIIILVYVPLLTFSGVEGKMFEPMALTVIIALAAAFVLSITFVPALIAIAVTGRVREGENAAVRGLKRIYAPLLKRAVASPLPVIAGAVILFGGAFLLFKRLGQEFIPTLDEKNIAMHALRIPSTGLAQSQAMQFAVEKDHQPVSPGGLCLLEDRHGRNCLRSDAAKRIRYLHHFQAAGGLAGPEITEGIAGRRARARREGIARQRLRVHAANPDALQRTHGRRAW